MIQELKGVKTIKETEGFGPYELEEFFDVALDLLCIADTDGYFIKVNKAWSDILGYPKDVLEERKFLDFVHPEDIQSTLDVISKLENQEQVLNFTNRYKAKDGSYRFIEWRSQPKGNLIYAAARDITEHKEMEENLRQREAHLRGILESQFDLIVRVDLENRFTYVNDAYCKTFGKKQEELLGQSFTPLVHIDDIDSTLKAMEKLFEPPYRVYIEQRAMTVKGWRWIAWEDSSILNERGEVVEIQGVGRDITQYKLAEEDLKMAHLELENRVLARTKELKNANEQLEKASKFKSEFLANMSHEVRNPMNAVTGLCQLALKKILLKKLRSILKKYRFHLLACSI